MTPMAALAALRKIKAARAQAAEQLRMRPKV